MRVAPSSEGAGRALGLGPRERCSRLFDNGEDISSSNADGVGASSLWANSTPWKRISVRDRAVKMSCEHDLVRGVAPKRGPRSNRPAPSTGHRLSCRNARPLGFGPRVTRSGGSEAGPERGRTRRGQALTTTMFGPTSPWVSRLRRARHGFGGWRESVYESV